MLDDRFKFTFHELAEKFSISVQTLYSWQNKGLPTEKHGRTKYVDIADFMEFYYKYKSYHRQIQSEDDMHPRDLRDKYDALLKKLDYNTRIQKLIEPETVLHFVQHEYNMVRNQITRAYVGMVSDCVNISDEAQMLDYLKTKSHDLCAVLKHDRTIKEEIKKIDEQGNISE